MTDDNDVIKKPQITHEQFLVLHSVFRLTSEANPLIKVAGNKDAKVWGVTTGQVAQNLEISLEKAREILQFLTQKRYIFTKKFGKYTLWNLNWVDFQWNFGKDWRTHRIEQELDNEKKQNEERELNGRKTNNSVD